MKNFFYNIWFVFLVIILILGAVFGIVSFFAPFVEILGGGSIVKGVLLLPFGIFGTVQFFRGAINVLESDCTDMECAGHKQGWKLTAYILFSLFSYFALIKMFQAIPI